MRTFFILFIVAICFACNRPQNTKIQDETGKTYCGWSEGDLDMHHIYTGRGESNFYLFPDGTSMLIDAGDWDPADYPKMCEELPDSSRRAGEWIARYIERINPFKKEVDYLVISHFHSDHTGDCTNNATQTVGRNPDYVLTGVAEVGETIRFKKAIDRGWADYQYPVPIQDADIENYRVFVNWKMQTDGLVAERFIPGSAKQITLLKTPEKYRDLLTVQNLSANGEIWTGVKDRTIKYYDLHPQNNGISQNENTKSIGIRISYGPFRYYAGGDISGFLLDEGGNSVNIEEVVAKACGVVQVCKVNHHAYLDAMTEGFLRNIQAAAYIIPVWDYEHIQPSILERMSSKQLYTGNRTIYATHIPDTLRKAYANEPWLSTVCPQTGHIVVKVFDEGKQYKIYVLSARDESQTVEAVYGPYQSAAVL